jgi:hypothetical protein
MCRRSDDTVSWLDDERLGSLGSVTWIPLPCTGLLSPSRTWRSGRPHPDLLLDFNARVPHGSPGSPACPTTRSFFAPASRSSARSWLAPWRRCRCRLRFPDTCEPGRDGHAGSLAPVGTSTPARKSRSRRSPVPAPDVTSPGSQVSPYPRAGFVARKEECCARPCHECSEGLG